MDVRSPDWLQELPDRPRSWIIDVLASIAGYLSYFGTLALFGMWRASLLDPAQFALLVVPTLIILRLCRYAPDKRWLPFTTGLGLSLVLLFERLVTSTTIDSPDMFIFASAPIVILGVAAALGSKLTR